MGCMLFIHLKVSLKRFCSARLIPQYIRDPGGSRAFDSDEFCPLRMQRGRLGGIEPIGFRDVRQRPYNRWSEAHACKSNTHGGVVSL